VDYKECSELCSYGCGRKRRKGQRVCSKCHAKEMRVARAAVNGEDAEKTIMNAAARVVRKRRGTRAMPEGMREKLEALCKEVVQKIDGLNGVGRKDVAA